MISYIFVGVGSVMAFVFSLLHLKVWQWLSVLEITGLGSNLAFILTAFAGRAQVLQPLTAWIATSLPILCWFYIISDFLLLIIFASLRIFMWGNMTPLTWQMIATSSFSFYIADMWFKYGIRYPNYGSGILLRCFSCLLGFYLELELYWN